MAQEVRLTWTVLRVLRSLLEPPTAKHYGFEVCKDTRLPSGTVYPVLMRLEQAGWLESAWEDVDPKEAKRPRRRFYRLTGEGVHRALTALQDASGFSGCNGISPRVSQVPEGRQREADRRHCRTGASPAHCHGASWVVVLAC
jgi:PadR family transcriptional regulator, regulatory protein PadR